ncbi:MAG: oligosaccharide flippase family protein [Tepidisphaeraceae bacterium]|jgi:O-antigen/teichoic acid export membrane protein
MTFTDSIRNRIGVLLPAGTVRARLARGAFWSALGSVGSGCVSIGSFIVVARLLGRPTFGKLGWLQSTIGTFGLFAGLTLGPLASKHIAEFKITNHTRAGHILGLSFIVGSISGMLMMLLAVILAPLIASRVINAPELTPCLQIAAPVLLFSALNGIQTGTLSGLEAFRVLSLSSVLGAVLNGALMITGTALGGLRGSVIAWTVSAICGFLINRAFIARELEKAGFKPVFRGAMQEQDVLWRFMLPSLLSASMVAPVTWAVNSILMNTTHGPSEMGLFNAANQWRTLLLFLPQMLLPPLIPVVCELNATGQFARLARTLSRTMMYSSMIVSFLGLPIVLLAPLVMKMYGPEFVLGATALRFVVLTAVFLSAGIVVGGLLVSISAMWEAFSLNCFWAIILLVSATLSARRWGATGISASYAIAYLLHTIAQIVYFRWKCGKLHSAGSVSAISATGIPSTQREI